ncbi:MAG: MBL fold metallo-hydrolase [Pseudomonadota bacterium]
MKIRILSNNTSSRKDLVPEHGLALWIEGEDAGRKSAVLFDTGGPHKTLLHNAQKLGINWEILKGVALSHGHYDHTGGLLDLLKALKKKIPVHLHPDALLPKLNGPSPDDDIGFSAVNLSANTLEKERGRLILSKKPVALLDHLMTTGEIPRSTDFEEVTGFFTVRNGEYVSDTMTDDLSLIVDHRGKGMFIVCGCCHAGIINTLLHSMALTGQKKVIGIMGGFHLVGANEDRISKTIAALKEIDPGIILPMHCTGTQAMERMQEAFGEKVMFLHCGDEWEV